MVYVRIVCQVLALLMQQIPSPWHETGQIFRLKIPVTHDITFFSVCISWNLPMSCHVHIFVEVLKNLFEWWDALMLKWVLYKDKIGKK